MSKRNTLSDLYRILFAMCILCYHGLVPVDLPYFRGANYLVEYFFFITGFFAFKLMDRYTDRPVLKGTLLLGRDRLRKCGIPLLLAWLCNVGICIVEQHHHISLHYLWFIHIMVLILCAYFIVYRLSKQNRTILLAVAVCLFVCSEILRLMDFIYDYYNECRGTAAVSLGIICSCLPRPRIRDEARFRKLCLPLSLLFLALIAVNNVLSMNTATKRFGELIFDVLLMPGLFLTALNTRLPFSLPAYMNKCALYIYIWQCAARLLSHWINSRWILFGAVMLLTVLCCAADALKDNRIRKNAFVPLQTIQPDRSVPAYRPPANTFT